ncbi:MAG: DNA polymerase III subunit gamma/tau [Alphaproteobacteria bacterium]|nr:MAG: DNA polymerase III subunit gamma/tau [Alphaproteobacteria bacterium]
MTESDTASTPYQVLARKYRPQTFADLIGQDAMVRTLKNAFAADRIAQAFIMTGIRGTGKTTTARIIAKGMNCVGPDGTGGPTTEPCGVCEHCTAIAEGRHVDVIEMDAASRTGVGDIREIIESVHYRAASARYKIYIIDEVHMLSTSAFNALLKTLEEPPAHVKFIFATTEIRKVPVTVLSRCQRFDLRRVEPETMIAHLRRIATAEGATIGDDALALIARASEGSVRDAMSLLDQAIAHGAGETSAEQVRDMLGLADRGRIMDLFERIMAGDPAGALAELSQQYADGADPVVVLRDLAEVTHWISLLKISPDAAEDPAIGPDERQRGTDLAARLPMRALTRAWQMLLKAIEETAAAPSPMMAAEMAVIRLTHVAELPSPEEIVRRLSEAPGSPGPGSGPERGTTPGATRGTSPGGPAPGASSTARPATGAAPGIRAHAGSSPGGAPGRPHATAGQAAEARALAPASAALARLVSFESVVELIRERRDAKLLIDVETGVRLVRYEPGRIEFEPAPGAPKDLAQRLGQRLQAWTGARWAVSIVTTGGAPTIAEARERRAAELREAVASHPLVAKALATFSGAEIQAVRTREEIARDAATEALPEVDEEWDPFEEN